MEHTWTARPYRDLAFRSTRDPTHVCQTDQPKPQIAIIKRMSIQELRSRRHEILSLAARHGVRNIRVFGSVGRGDDRPSSDLDLLVEVEQGRSLLDIVGLEQDLADLLGCRVDVLTDGGLSPYLQQRILNEAASL